MGSSAKCCSIRFVGLDFPLSLVGGEIDIVLIHHSKQVPNVAGWCRMFDWCKGRSVVWTLTYSLVSDRVRIS